MSWRPPRASVLQQRMTPKPSQSLPTLNGRQLFDGNRPLAQGRYGMVQGKPSEMKQDGRNHCAGVRNGIVLTDHPDVPPEPRSLPLQYRSRPTSEVR